MNATEEMLEFSRTYFAGPEPSNDIRGATWSVDPDSAAAHRAMVGGGSFHADARFATWGGWTRRGIPELGSPLAD
jgi:hypothetical protein